MATKKMTGRSDVFKERYAILLRAACRSTRSRWAAPT